MASQSYQPHFILIPLMTQGHLIPMVDIARLLAQRDVTVTIVTTPHNFARFGSIIDRDIRSGKQINVLQLPFQSTENGLPEGCENVDTLPSPSLIPNLMAAIAMLQKPLEQLFEELKPSPSCIVTDKYLAWTADTAAKFKIPRIVFDGTSCFASLCSHNLDISKVYEKVSESSETFVVPGLPDRIEFTRAQLPGSFNPGSLLDLKKFRDKIRAAEAEEYGVLVNTFEELEPEYAKGYQKAKGKKVWCIGPVSLCNKELLDRAQRGNKASTDENQCLKWLDSWAPNSVIYACFGSINRITPPQLIELGLGLEATNRPFIWVIRGAYKKEDIEKWLIEDGFEERVRGRGLIIRGWSPQVLILSHPAIGGFLTHCGWNSTTEGICAGVPMITWPLFAEQFYNEKFVVQILDIGVRVGAEVVVHMGEEDKVGVVVKREQVKEAIEKIMGEGKEREERRERAKNLAKMANKAVDEGGSSYLHLTLFIEDVIHQVRDKNVRL
ncbi:UDPGT domain-containing protein [Cephalotus follicularis]|uniref:Glycosyltransferase n=1 Tax=Cephalotus follicularis TaxID=3775 RepID=A0A1Q3AT62_CEPFO|nr:UDPGT domain-containing protein [Cephalotus follicularis]